MKLEKQLIALAGLCSEKVLVPEEVGCCGFAGDKGFTHPEVNAYALRKLRVQLEKAGIEVGYSIAGLARSDSQPTQTFLTCQLFTWWTSVQSKKAETANKLLSIIRLATLQAETKK